MSVSLSPAGTAGVSLSSGAFMRQRYSITIPAQKACRTVLSVSPLYLTPLYLS